MKILSTSISKTDGATWATIEPTSMDSATFAAYEAYREAMAMAVDLQREFEVAFRKEAGRDGIRFGYRFGKLSVALGEAPKAKAVDKPRASLSDFFAAQANGGHRA